MKKLLLAIFGIIGFISAYSQTSPTIIGITFDDLNQKYSLIWNKVEGTDSTIIYKYRINNDGTGTPEPIDTVGSNTTIYLLNDLNIDEIKYFTVESYKIGNTPSTANIAKQLKQSPSNIILKGVYNSCTDLLKLSWNHYYGYGDTALLQYNIYFNGVYKYKVIGNNSFTISYSDLKKLYNTAETGKFEIRLNYTGGAQSTSNVLNYTLPTITDPTYINATGTTVFDMPISDWTTASLRAAESSNKVSLYFKTDKEESANTFNIYRYNKKNKAVVDKIYPTYDPVSNSYIDDTVDITNQYVYYTKLSKCGSESGLTSNNESNIVIRIAKTSNSSQDSIIWTSYDKFLSKDFKYNLYRARDGYPVKTSPIKTTTGYFAIDDLYSIDKIQAEELICYYVEAVEENNPHQQNGYAVSNLACKTLAAVDLIEMPKYLTLGKDCKSPSTDPFRFPPVMVPVSFQMIIYDRWGTQVFETKTYTEGWDGTIKGGFAPQGGYVYYIKFQGNSGKIGEKRGSLVVLCQ